jgi:D-erythronate 2-dehydrogenase
MRVLVIGSAGFIGQTLVRRLRAGVPVGPEGEPAGTLTQLDLRPVQSGPAGSGVSERFIAGDICDRALLEHAVADGVDCVFHLASVPGGAAERNFELGLKVNLESTINLLEVLRTTGTNSRLVFASTVGIYGVPMPDVIDEDTLPQPSLSYGAHKFAGEVLLADYSRRGFVDGRTLRIPGIVARPPAGGMLSIFLSDLIRELSAGRSVVCPVEADAPSWWMSRPCVVDNLLHAAALPTALLPPQRSYLLPVQRLTMAEVVNAIAARCGHEVLGRVSYRPDPRLQRQFASYPPLQAPRAEAAGFRHDGDAATLIRRALLNE